MAGRRGRLDRQPVRPLWLELLAGSLVCAVLGALDGALASPWNQDEDLAALGSLDGLLAYEDLQQAVQRAEDAWEQPSGGPDGARPAGPLAGASASALASAQQSKAVPWQPAEPDPQLYLLTEYDRGGQARVKRNREAGAVAVAGRPAPPRAGSGSFGMPAGLRRHARNPPGSSGQRLSIVNPLDVLRQRLLLEIARRRKASVPQSNREMLEGIGKRSYNSMPTSSESIEQQIQRCLSQLSESLNPQDKLARLALLYRAVEYGKCDLSNDLVDQLADQQKQIEQWSSQGGGTVLDRTGGSASGEQEQQEWGTAATRATRPQQAAAWPRNARAATSNLTS